MSAQAEVRVEDTNTDPAPVFKHAWDAHTQTRANTRTHSHKHTVFELSQVAVDRSASRDPMSETCATMTPES